LLALTDSLAAQPHLAANMYINEIGDRKGHYASGFNAVSLA
jgi:hypothetical protein